MKPVAIFSNSIRDGIIDDSKHCWTSKERDCSKYVNENTPQTERSDPWMGIGRQEMIWRESHSFEGYRGFHEWYYFHFEPGNLVLTSLQCE